MASGPESGGTRVAVRMVQPRPELLILLAATTTAARAAGVQPAGTRAPGSRVAPERPTASTPLVVFLPISAPNGVSFKTGIASGTGGAVDLPDRQPIRCHRRSPTTWCTAPRSCQPSLAVPEAERRWGLDSAQASALGKRQDATSLAKLRQVPPWTRLAEVVACDSSEVAARS
jgi:hypothetical protein